MSQLVQAILAVVGIVAIGIMVDFPSAKKILKALITMFYKVEADTQALLDWQMIEDWAMNQPPDAEIGRTHTNIDCPLARYLNEKTGYDWSVGPSIKRMGTKERLAKPDWVNDLIARVDALSGKTSCSVSCKQFLDILDIIYIMWNREEKPLSSRIGARKTMSEIDKCAYNKREKHTHKYQIIRSEKDDIVRCCKCGKAARVTSNLNGDTGMYVPAWQEIREEKPIDDLWNIAQQVAIKDPTYLSVHDYRCCPYCDVAIEAATYTDHLAVFDHPFAHADSCIVRKAREIIGMDKTS